MSRVTELVINGVRRTVDVDSERSLLDVLREELDLIGSKYGCGEGRCGACTVLVDGRPVRSCSVRVGAATGKAIRTIEGLEQNGRLHPLQVAFLRHDAMQCAYCTSGMIMSGVALLESTPHPSDDEIRRFMNGNICRCGTYPRILAAVRDAAQTSKAVSHD